MSYEENKSIVNSTNDGNHINQPPEETREKYCSCGSGRLIVEGEEYCKYCLAEWEQNRQYIVCSANENGNLTPMGDTKKEDHARELAKLHKKILCKILIVEDYSKP